MSDILDDIDGLLAEVDDVTDRIAAAYYEEAMKSVADLLDHESSAVGRDVMHWSPSGFPMDAGPCDCEGPHDSRPVGLPLIDGTPYGLTSLAVTRYRDEGEVLTEERALLAYCIRAQAENGDPDLSRHQLAFAGLPVPDGPIGLSDPAGRMPS